MLLDDLDQAPERQPVDWKRAGRYLLLMLVGSGLLGLFIGSAYSFDLALVMWVLSWLGAFALGLLIQFMQWIHPDHRGRPREEPFWYGWWTYTFFAWAILAFFSFFGALFNTTS
jgi:hypothetical protein